MAFCDFKGGMRPTRSDMSLNPLICNRGAWIQDFREGAPRSTNLVECMMCAAHEIPTLPFSKTLYATNNNAESYNEGSSNSQP